MFDRSSYKKVKDSETAQMVGKVFDKNFQEVLYSNPG